MIPGMSWGVSRTDMEAEEGLKPSGGNKDTVI